MKPKTKTVEVRWMDDMLYMGKNICLGDIRSDFDGDAFVFISMNSFMNDKAYSRKADCKRAVERAIGCR